MVTSARHSVKSSEWYTPDWILDPVRATLETIDLDPASSPEANEMVQAYTYFDGIHKDGLTRPWANGCKPFSVFCNPPSPAADWWAKLMKELELGNIRQAIFLAYSIEAIQVTQRKHYRPMADFPICFISKRVGFIDGEREVAVLNGLKEVIEVKPNPGYLKPKAGMTHSSALIYVPGTEDRSADFEIHGSTLGAVMYPSRMC